nr:GTP cyclohydrolase I FolE [Orenia marismortui]
MDVEVEFNDIIIDEIDNFDCAFLTNSLMDLIKLSRIKELRYTNDNGLFDKLVRKFNNQLYGLEEGWGRMNKKKIERAVRNILEAIDEDPTREGLQRTPERVAQMYEDIFAGTNQNPEEHLEFFSDDMDYEDLILVKDIIFYSMCEHHLIPFFGKVHIAYIPKEGRITGFSRLARLVETVARRLQLQERMNKMIADAIVKILEPLGVLVIVEAEQMCMTMRGIKKTESRTITSAVRGIFKEDSASRAEVMNLIKGSD